MAIAHITQDDKQLKEEFGEPFYERDYVLLETYYPGILEKVEKMVSRGKSPDTVKKWAEEYLDEADSKWLKRIHNAAKYVANKR